MNKWKVAYVPNYMLKNKEIKTISDIKTNNLPRIEASVPGNFELDFMKSGNIPDLYYSVNTLEAQKLENLHLFYYTTFDMPQNSYLHFNGIDTIADIYINGKLEKSTNNMFIEYDVYAPYKERDNEIVVHIKPCVIEARKYDLPVACSANKYNYSSLYVRKAAHCFGWDIMPRIVTGGIWKEVEIREKRQDYLKEVYIVTDRINFEKNRAALCLYVNGEFSGDFATDYKVKVKGVCGDSEFSAESKMWHTTAQINLRAENIKLWWPKNYGEPCLYDTVVELYYKGKLVDSVHQNVGIRTVELQRTDCVCENGKFQFVVNGKKIFVLGTNWVPLDAFHSNDKNRVKEALDLLDDIGCNMVRCWGGSVYENEEFFDFCDRHGIMIWQDFAMGCAVYPQEESFYKMLTEEVVQIVKKKRIHPSLVVWSGDNEGDISYDKWGVLHRNPNRNKITRELLPSILEMHDYNRPYLESSPYISNSVYENKLKAAEDHLWGPRDYFKGSYYKNASCYFASETGYHGCPSPNSLKKFLEKPWPILGDGGTASDEYIVHAASMEVSEDAIYSYRIKLMCSQVDILFNRKPENLDEFAKMSQISQAEAKKYFIERFRIRKNRNGGIIWWNLLDGWPQISDAVVDYYFTKKLAYSYIKHAQYPICLMFDEPENNYLSLYAVNDTQEYKEIKYSIKNVTENKDVFSGCVRLTPDSCEKIFVKEILPEEKSFYLIQWEADEKIYKNHYFTNIIDIDYESYMDSLSKSKMNEFEGF